MKEVKFRYRFELGYAIKFFYFTLREIESHKGLTKVAQKRGYYKILSRDLYIGLKDKNGKEIYEGDIVKCHFWNSMWFDTIETIEIDPMNGCEFCLKTSIGGKDEIWEIIGNIYENPELLEK